MFRHSKNKSHGVLYSAMCHLWKAEWKRLSLCKLLVRFRGRQKQRVHFFLYQNTLSLCHIWNIKKFLRSILWESHIYFCLILYRNDKRVFPLLLLPFFTDSSTDSWDHYHAKNMLKWVSRESLGFTMNFWAFAEQTANPFSEYWFYFPCLLHRHLLITLAN